MGDAREISLEASTEALLTLAGGLTRFGAAQGSPDWFTAVVWLCAPTQEFVATASPHLLDNGLSVCTLRVEPPEEFLERIATALPNIRKRLDQRGADNALPPVPDKLPAPAGLASWAGSVRTLSVLERQVATAGDRWRVACGLLFGGGQGRRLLVASDRSSLAVILTEEPDAIDAYVEECAKVDAVDYAAKLDR